jgi:hypothetical protein
MKAKSIILSVFIVVNYCSTLLGQAANCSDFSVVGVNQDTLNPNEYYVSIQFNAASSIFINYPYVAAVLDCNGDSVATGGIFVFGQVGQSTLAYPVTVSGSLACEPLTVVFVYGDENLNNDTCAFTFGESSASVQLSEQSDKFSIYPNPAVNQVQIKTNHNHVGSNFYVYDFTGKMVFTGLLMAENTTVDMSEFSSGMYLIKIGSDVRDVLKW